MTLFHGFFGKIPDRGDFIRHGLPQSFVSPLDAWWQAALAGSRTILGSSWTAAWMEAPIWRFALPAGLCGPGAAVGLWMPSADKAGRLFPLTVAAVGQDWTCVARSIPFLAAAERAGLQALDPGGSPAALSAALAAATAIAGEAIAPPPPGSSVWWTQGSPCVAAAAHTVPGMPDGLLFSRMLQDPPRDAGG